MSMLEVITLPQKKSKVRELYLKNNNINDFGLKKIKSWYDGYAQRDVFHEIFIDLFDKFKYIDEE